MFSMLRTMELDASRVRGHLGHDSGLDTSASALVSCLGSELVAGRFVAWLFRFCALIRRQIVVLSWGLGVFPS